MENGYRFSVHFAGYTIPCGGESEAETLARKLVDANTHCPGMVCTITPIGSATVLRTYRCGPAELPGEKVAKSSEFRFSVRTEKGEVGNWQTDFQGNAAETRAYILANFMNKNGFASAQFKAGRFRVYGGVGGNRAKLGIKVLKAKGVL